ncbi:ThiF family adenylyltransferase [Paenibacillus thiaminolyticus]|uniref:Thiamine biosynthesis protein ThiF n=1 Tax=Paenibacillus thiaminolyticus TaxID=49283 RepID=A0A3A3GUP6_PANTH|nr:ThiF family adenylyltransferase [Paenibacillus thiaminolyticus]RJG21373.1 thiamine biosynthesis protein ThiF [Paenibacillus thiaminolyticus]
MNTVQIDGIGKGLYINFYLIGAGANGSHFFRSLCQDIRTYMDADSFHLFFDEILLIDGDIVEKKNLGNQLFDEEDVSKYKVHSLADRYGGHYHLNIKAYADYIKDVAIIQRLICPTAYDESQIIFIPFVIAMVDNNKTRQILHELFMSDETPNLLYLDAGVEAVSKDKDETSGFGGQVVLGFKLDNQVILEPVATVFPDVFEEDEIPMPGCGATTLSAPQRATTNKFAAQISNNVVNNILHNHTIYTHVINFNAQVAGSRAQMISHEQVKAFTEAIEGMGL